MTTPVDAAGYVLVDSCVFCADLHGAGASASIFKEGVERLNFTLLLPEIVRDEVINKYYQALASNLSMYESCIHNIRRHIGGWPKLEFPEIDATNIEKKYSSHFPYSIEASRIRILAYPETNHKDIAARAIARKKPFKETGAGYRDTLICETLKLFLLSNPEANVSFITLNHRDFLENGNLHPEILHDFEANGIAKTRIETFQTLGDFNNKYFFPKLKVLDGMLENFIANKETRFSVRKWVLDELTTLLRDEEWADIITGVDFVHSYISKCDDPLSIDYDDVRQLPSGDILLSISLRLHVELSIRYDGTDYDRDYNAMCELVGEPDGPVGDCTSWVPIETSLAISLVLDKDSFDVKSSQVDNLEGNGGWCEAQPHPSKR